jgi:ribosomal protein L7Ae-like RNA K-turn-binding protein
VCDRLIRVLNLIGIAQRAGKVSAGTQAAKNSLVRKKAFLLLLSEDIADNAKESLLGTCKKNNIPYAIVGNKYELGTCVGKAYRVAVTINDIGLAKAIIAAMNTETSKGKTMGVVEWPK